MFQNNKSLNKFNYNNFLEFFFYFIIFITPLITTNNDQQNINRILALQIIFIFLLLFKKNFLNLIINSIKNNQKTVIILSLFLISITISYIGSPGKIEDWGFRYVRHKYLQTIIFFLFFAFIYVYLSNFKISFNKFRNSVILSLLLFVCLTYIKKFFPLNSEIYNYLSFFKTIRSPSYILTSGIVLVLGFYSFKKKHEIKLKEIIILSFLVSMAIFYGSRGNLLSIIITFILLIIYKKIIKEQSCYLIKIFLISLFFGWLISETFSAIYSLIIIQQGPSFNDVQTSNQILRMGKESFYDRIEIWIASYNLFLENLFFGSGPNSLFLLQANNLLEIKGWWLNKNMIISHTHNFVLQFLIEWGIVGTLLILFLMTKNILKGIIILIKKQNKYLIVPVLNVAGLTAHGMVDGTYIHPVTVTFLLISNAMIAANVKFK